jgi:hypothetical protein
MRLDDRKISDFCAEWATPMRDDPPIRESNGFALQRKPNGGRITLNADVHLGNLGLDRSISCVPIDRKPEVVAQGHPCGDRFGVQARSEPIDCRGGSGLLDHRGLRIIELPPHDDHGEGEKHRVNHTDCRELEARDVVIAGQSLERKQLADSMSRSGAPSA